MNTYKSMCHAFGHISDALNSAMIKPAECKVMIQVPDERQRLALGDAIRAGSGPIMSAAPAVDLRGKWNGIEYEFTTKPNPDELIDRELIHAHAVRLLHALCKKHFPQAVPLNPLPTICGVIDQIDNLTTSLERKK